MIFFKVIDCNHYQEINAEILQYVQTHFDISAAPDFWNPLSTVDFLHHTPLFVQWCKQHNVLIKSLALTVGTHPNCCGPHIDTPPAKIKLSWPICNTQTTYNRWFKELVDHCTVDINHWGGTIYKDMAQLQEIHRKKVNSPMLINAGIPHDVWFEDTSVYPRLGLQCQLLKEPDSL